MSSPELTFVCWLWTGWRPVYDYRHVNRLQRLLARSVKRKHKLICITDSPSGILCETFPLWKSPEVPGVAPGRPNCFSRLRMFDPKIGRLFGDHIISIDLDVAIPGDITSLFYNLPSFKACRGYKSHLCGSMWWLATGRHRDVWDTFDPIDSPAYIAERQISGSDQAWMSIRLPDAQLWSERDGVYQYLEMSAWERRHPPANTRIVFFAGNAKPWDRIVQMERSPLYDPIT